MKYMSSFKLSTVDEDGANLGEQLPSLAKIDKVLNHNFRVVQQPKTVTITSRSEEDEEFGEESQKSVDSEFSDDCISIESEELARMTAEIESEGIEETKNNIEQVKNWRLQNLNRALSKIKQSGIFSPQRITDTKENGGFNSDTSDAENANKSGKRKASQQNFHSLENFVHEEDDASQDQDIKRRVAEAARKDPKLRTSEDLADLF